MADVFISYSRADHARVRPVADRLVSLGYNIWWDKQLRAGQRFVDEIERQLESARAVLTAWTHNARNSTWVYAESSRGLDANKFIQVRLDNVQLPLPFDALQVCDLSARAPQWGQLEQTVARLVRQGTPPAPERRIPELGMFATPAVAGAPKLLATATAATVAAYAGAVTATYNGAMSPEQLQLALTGVVGVASASTMLTLERLFAIARAGG